MSGYAVRKDGQGWRAVNSAADCTADENFSEVQPGPIVPSKQSRINALNAEYEKDLTALNNAWVSAKRVDGANEDARLAIINAQITARGQKLQSDIQAILMEQ